mgnify:FL=1
MVPDLTDCPLKPYVAYATPKIKIAPFTAPALDMALCEVDLPRVLYPKAYANLQKLKRATQKKSTKTKTTSSESTLSDALQIEASSL